MDANTTQLLVEGIRLASLFLMNQSQHDQFYYARQAAQRAKEIASAEGRTVLPSDVSRAVDEILAANAGRLAVLRPKAEAMKEETGVAENTEGRV